MRDEPRSTPLPPGGQEIDDRPQPAPAPIGLNLDWLDRKLGKVVPAGEVRKILDALMKEHGIPGKVVDVSNEKEVEAFFESYTAEHGAPDVLINNAGITADALFIKKKGEEITKFPLSSWEKVLNVNLTLCREEMGRF